MDVVDVRDCLQLTPIEQRIADILSDGLPHHRTEVLARIDAKYKNINSLAVHIWNLRMKVRELRHDIVTEYRRGGIHYRHVILLPACKVNEDTF